MGIQNSFRAALVAVGLFAISLSANAHWDVGISVGFAPPPLPVYVQPPCPEDGYLWTPGYWAYDQEVDGGYFWVPGTWVLAPRPGLLWTPGYWGADGAYFAWHSGYWGPEVGFYGGINYGFGYFGVGFGGGYWRDRDFFYNRAVANVTNASITNVYNTTVVNNYGTRSRTSYNGGREGTRLQPSRNEMVAARLPHFAPTGEQLRHESGARSMPALSVAANHGIPPLAATARPGAFERRDLPAARRTDGTPFDRSAGVTGRRPDIPAARASSGEWSRPAASAAGRPDSFSAREGGNTPRSDRPSWASRNTAPVRAAARASGNGEYRYGANSRAGTSVRAAQAPPVESRRDTWNPSHDPARNDSYRASSAPAPRYPAPTRSAPDYRYAAREPARTVYPRPTLAPSRDVPRPSSFNPGRPAAAPPPPRPTNAPHPSNQRFENVRGRQ